MSGRALTFTVACLVVACGVLVYLEWWRAGELENLNGRLVDLERYRDSRRSSRKAPAPEAAT